MIHDVTLTADAPETWAGVWVEFAARRSQLVRAVLVRDGVEDVDFALTDAQRWLTERIELTLPQPASVDVGETWIVRYEYLGEPMAVVSKGVSREAASHGVVPESHVSTLGDEPDGTTDDEGGDSIRQGGAAELFEKRRELIEADPVRGHIKAFFYELDVLTHPAMFHESAHLVADVAATRARQVLAFVNALKGRVLARARHAFDPSRYEEPRHVEGDGVPRSTVAAFSAMQISLFHQYFNRADGSIDWEAFDEAFELFATGRLRVIDVAGGGRVYNGEPDSAYFFTFAEFALLAIELGIDEDTWARALPGLVAAVPQYMHIYWPAGFDLDAGCHFADWRTRTWSVTPHLILNHAPTAEVEGWKQEVRACGTSGELGRLFGRHALRAFREEVSYVRPAPA